MRRVVLGAVIGTTALVVSSYFGTPTQLASITLASMLGALLAIYIIRTSYFAHLGYTQILALAVVLHLLALGGQPLLEDDYYRYLWDALRFAQDGTPYGIAPSAFFDDARVPPAFQTILNGINYPDIATVYGPGLQAWFLAGYAIAPGSVEALQALNVVASLATLRLLIYCGATPPWLLLYAISPLLLKESVINAHPDVLLGLLTLAAFALGGRRAPGVAGGLLGLAIACKASVVLLLPFLWFRGGARALLAAGFTLLLCYLPFWLQSGSDLAVLSNFAQHWRFNPLIYALLEGLAGPQNGRLLAGMAIAACCLVLYWRDARAGHDRPAIPPVQGVLGVLLLFSPVVNPWYLLWLLPFAVLRPSRVVWTATFLLPLSYWNGTHSTLFGGHAFDVPLIVTAAELAALAIAAQYDRARPLHYSDWAANTLASGKKPPQDSFTQANNPPRGFQ